jgi:predicted nucleotidyltransferase component of viral defense system
MENKLHLEIFPDYQFDKFMELSEESWINEFYLAGGTALALQLGHRESIDFDFFTNTNFNQTEILDYLHQFGKLKVITQTNNIIFCFIDNIQISFFKVSYKLVDVTLEYKNINIASLKDIFLMKLQAIAGRGSRKDFIDLYFLLNYFNLEDATVLYKLKYNIDFLSDYHLHKSLIYFNDAEKMQMPKMLIPTDWNNVKNTIIEKVKSLNQNFK